MSERAMEYQMSNSELADAITAAHNRSGSCNEDQRVQHEHMKNLLAVQLERAKIVVADVRSIQQGVVQ